MAQRSFIHSLVFLLLCFFSVQSVAADKAIKRVMKTGQLVIGVSGDQAPFVMLDAKNQLMGYDIDLAKALAHVMRVDAVFKIMPFNKLLLALDNGNVDIVISGMNITLARAQKVLFAGPYAMAGKSILTKSDILADNNQLENYDTHSIKVVALKNSTSEEFVKEFMPTAQYTALNTYDDGLMMVKDGSADIMVANMQFCLIAVLSHPQGKLMTLNKPLSIEPVGIAVADKNPGLHSLLQNYLDSYQTMGLLQKLHEKWFKDRSWLSQLPNKTIAM